MKTLVYLICIAVASFAVLAQPAVAQGANTTLPLTYPGQVLQGDGSQTCLSGAQRGIARNDVKNATWNLLQESVVTDPTFIRVPKLILQFSILVVGPAGDV